ncbi:MAG: 4Fe-4S binding protein [Candidatus Aenigmatarchaeota archaeon]|nr:MAG: 4Fe-4S binding protein [Candidatus Aenigmarchaeota archaeon]
MLTMQIVLLKQLFKRAFTNKFPVKHAPDSVTKLLGEVEKGEKELNPPVPVEKDYRGKIMYHRDRCIGCQLCTKVCPAEAVVFQPSTKKITYHVFRCTFCGECVKICPVRALEFTPEFLLADYKRK